MTPDQMRMARAKLGLSQDEVAERSGMANKTLQNAERGDTQLSSDKLLSLRSFYESNGLEFTDHNGVREKPLGTRTFRGKNGFKDFYEFHFDTVRRHGGELWLYNGTSKYILEALGSDYIQMHKERMSKIKDKFTYKVIVAEGDNTFFGSDYAQYRWVPAEKFNDKTIFVFGPCVAFVNFDDEINVIVIEEKGIADTQRQLMETSWSEACEPS